MAPSMLPKTTYQGGPYVSQAFRRIRRFLRQTAHDVRAGFQVATFIKIALGALLALGLITFVTVKVFIPMSTKTAKCASSASSISTTGTAITGTTAKC